MATTAPKRARKTAASRRTSVQQPKQSEFRAIFQQFQASMNATREFVNHLHPMAVSLDQDIYDQKIANFRSMVVGSPPEAVAELQEFIESIEPKKKVKRRKAELEVKTTEGAMLIRQMVRDLTSVVISPGHQELLHRAMLMSLTSYFEVLVSDLVHAFYAHVPDAALGNEKVLSTNELRSFDSVEEAFRFVVSHRVDELLRGSVGDWDKFFEGRMKISVLGLAPSPAQWMEMFQRRHVLVHAGGKASMRYLESVDWNSVSFPPSRPRPGQLVSVDKAYIDLALDYFEIVGILLSQSVWAKYAPSELDSRLAILHLETVYPAMLAGRWRVVEGLTDWELNHGGGDEMHSLVARFNNWLSIKRQGRWAEIAKDVNGFDLSAKKPQFVLGWLSLREDRETFFTLLPQGLATGLTESQLREWPILDEMKSDARFEEILRDHEGNPAAPEPTGNGSGSSVS